MTGNFLAGADGLVGLLLWLGFLHRLLLGDERVEGHQLGVMAPVLLREVHWGLASVLVPW